MYGYLGQLMLEAIANHSYLSSSIVVYVVIFEGHKISKFLGKFVKCKFLSMRFLQGSALHETDDQQNISLESPSWLTFCEI